jgi:transposase
MGSAWTRRVFDSDAGGHRELVGWLTKRGRTAQVVLESTGTYSLDVALALHRARGVAVMVANPRAVKQSAGALMQRSKTDLTAAAALREYAARRPFVAWQPPAAAVLALRGIARRIAVLGVERARDRNRLHAVQATAEQVALVVNDIEVNIRHPERRIELLTAEAVAPIQEHGELHRERSTSVPGIATGPRRPRPPGRPSRAASTTCRPALDGPIDPRGASDRP